ncbi:hypothetical protein PAPHI01_2146 [Pancytospora philotis]|nr:hypothetical protein PAPHI01_2146 [Pancytospora philotis]
MIYGILEYCINSFNGPYHNTPAYIINYDSALIYALPYGCLYVAFVGLKTPIVSFVIVHTLLLFGFIKKINGYLQDMARTGLPPSVLFRALAAVLLNGTAIATAVTTLLYLFYFFESRRFIAIVGRVNHALLFLLINLLFRDALLCFVLRFGINKLVMFGFRYSFFAYRNTFRISVFVFVGVYYFLKLSPLWSAGLGIAHIENYFDFIIWHSDNTWRRLVLSYLLFTLLFAAAFRSQSALLAPLPARCAYRSHSLPCAPSRRSKSEADANAQRDFP